MQVKSNREESEEKEDRIFYIIFGILLFVMIGIILRAILHHYGYV